MREQNYLDRAKLNPARIFKSPMDVVENDRHQASRETGHSAGVGGRRTSSPARRRRRDEWRRACAPAKGASGPQPSQVSDRRNEHTPHRGLKR